MPIDDDLPRTGIYALTPAQRRELALALLARPKRDSDGLEALRRRYPTVPDTMVRTASHHLYVDGPEAVMDFLADAELTIRDPHHDIDVGPSTELLYHVYNWVQFRAILPEGRQDLLDLVEELKEYVQDKDWQAMSKTVQELDDILQGTRSPPDVTTL